MATTSPPLSRQSRRRRRLMKSRLSSLRTRSPARACPRSSLITTGMASRPLKKRPRAFLRRSGAQRAVSRTSMLNVAAKLVAEPFSDKVTKAPTRDGFGKGVVEAGKANKNVVVLCADLKESTRAEWFEKEFPERFIEVGVAEQAMATIASGMALAGKIPFI